MSKLEGRGSRGRFEGYRAERLKRPDSKESDPSAKGSVRHRSIGQLYRELFGILRGHRSSIALALLTLSVGTTLRLVPPAATKLVIDHVLMGRALPTNLPDWLPIPETPRGRLFGLVAGVFVISILGTAIGLWGRWLATRASKRLQVTTRRRVFEHAARLPLHRVYELKAGGAASLLREDAGGSAS